MRTNVYIDGFNLYYRLLRENPQCKWLDLKALSTELLQPQNRIQTVRYYTARISGRVDPTAPARQQIYLDALRTVPEVTIHLGSFLVTRPWAGLVHPPQMRGGTVPQFIPPFPTVAKVWKTEEKGSDVNLGSHLVRDAFQGKFEVAAVLSNDTDLAEPIRIVAEELCLSVGLLCPVAKPSGGLANVASFIRHIRIQHLQAAQFPDAIPGTSIVRPSTWR
ncbi:MAG: NYN domain-containing protein [Terracidiphilus sp.]